MAARTTWCIAALAFAMARPAFADTQTAEALFQSGKEAMARGEIAVACARFSESASMEPAAGSFLNLADCEERLGKLASALAHWQAARDRLRPDDPRMPRVAERIAQLTPRVPRLTIVTSVQSATILRDDTSVGAASLGVALPVDPGVHVIVMRAPGHAESRTEVTLSPGESRSIDVAPGPALAMARIESSPPERAHDSTGSTQRTLGLVVGGAGLVAIGTGAIFGWVSKSTYDDALTHCPAGPHSCDAAGVSGGSTAHSQATASTLLLIGGGALVATGLALYLTAPHMTIAPAVGDRQAGLRAVGTW